MTQKEIIYVLNTLCPTKWKVYEFQGSIEIVIEGFINSNVVVEMEKFRPEGVLFVYRTMSYFESLLTKKGDWKVVK